jgi:hypothetical protein
MLPTELFALSQGLRCEGRHRCHWCGAPCSEMHRAEDPVVPFVRRVISCARPDEPWQCAGCVAWRRPSMTVLFLSGDFMDRQSPEQHSWLITRDGAHALDFRDRECVEALRKVLMRPPLEFVLSLRSSHLKNHLHLSVCNVNAVVKADTPLTYTVDGTPFVYTVHQLTEAMVDPEKAPGKEPGVSDLVGRMGPMGEEAAVVSTSGLPPAKRGRGRPAGRAHTIGTEEQRMQDRQTKAIRMSGVGLVA